jgi:hypothetical protein
MGMAPNTTKAKAVHKPAPKGRTRKEPKPKSITKMNLRDITDLTERAKEKQRRADDRRAKKDMRDEAIKRVHDELDDALSPKRPRRNAYRPSVARAPSLVEHEDENDDNVEKDDI